MTKRGAQVAVSILSACAMTAAATMGAEGWKTHPYRDVNGIWTVCNGETLNVNPRKVYTEFECLQMFTHSMVQHGTDISPCLPNDTPVSMRAAFTDMSYNLGVGGFCRSAMAKRAQARDFRGSCAAISLYVFAGKRDCRIASNNCYGLVLRRQRERSQCEQGLLK